MKIPKILCFILSLTLMTACFSSCKKNNDDGAGYTFNCGILGNPKNLDPQIASDINSYTIIKNIYRGLLKFDSEGRLANDIAESYTVSDDGLEYTFKLSESSFWYSVSFDSGDENKDEDEKNFPVTADDFVFAFRRIFNSDMNSPHAETFSCLKHAEDIIAGNSPPSSLGVYAENPYELKIILDRPDADFLTLLTLPPAMPCNEEFFNNSKGRYGLDKESVASNGSFYITEWFYDPYGPESILNMKRHPYNSDSSDLNRVYPWIVNFTIEKSEESLKNKFDSGQIDYLLTEKLSNEYNDKSYKADEYQTASTGIIFNLSDDVYSNDNIRRAFALSINRDLLSESLEDDNLFMASGLIPPSVRLLNKSCRELLGEGFDYLYDEQEALRAYHAGLKNLGISGLDTVQILVKEDFPYIDNMQVFTQKWQELFGTYIGFESVSESDYRERLKNGNFQLAVYDAAGNYNSVFSIFQKFLDDCESLGHKNTAVENALALAHEKVNLNQSVEIFRSIETDILDDYVFLPVLYKPVYLVHRSSFDDFVFHPFISQLDFQYAKYYS